MLQNKNDSCQISEFWLNVLSNVSLDSKTFWNKKTVTFMLNSHSVKLSMRPRGRLKRSEMKRVHTTECIYSSANKLVKRQSKADASSRQCTVAAERWKYRGSETWTGTGKCAGGVAPSHYGGLEVTSMKNSWNFVTKPCIFRWLLGIKDIVATPRLWHRGSVDSADPARGSLQPLTALRRKLLNIHTARESVIHCGSTLTWYLMDGWMMDRLLY